MSRKKVTVVGGGFVGSTTAQRIVDLELADVVLTDILDGPPAGKALDMLESGPITGTDSRATGASTATGDYSATEGSDVVVITAGFPRKPGMSRDDLLKANYDVVKAVVEQIVKHSPNCIIIVVTNPLDAMAQAAFKVSGFPKNRVLGMAGVLDSARMSSFVATECKVSVENVHSFVLGGHGDDIEHCHFYYGAVVQRGDLQIAISTNGKSPALAQRLRKELERELGPEYEAWVQWLGAAREALRASGPNSESTKKLLHVLASRPMFQEFLRQANRRPGHRGAA